MKSMWPTYNVLCIVAAKTCTVLQATDMSNKHNKGKMSQQVSHWLTTQTGNNDYPQCHKHACERCIVIYTPRRCLALLETAKLNKP